MATVRDLSGHVSKYAEDFSAEEEVLDLFNRITDEDCELLWMDATIGLPENLIIQNLLVPPVSIRPSVPMDLFGCSTEANYVPSKFLESSGNLLESIPHHIHVLDEFLDENTAKELRGTFNHKFESPREGNPDRFVWDWWHVPDQYTLMRTTAQDYFDPKTFEDLTASLCKFGQEKLGCRAISPPWLSLYIDGCEQHFHTDSWHGPWAYVLSLTDFENKDFSGGQTKIMKPHVLNYWQNFVSGIGLEEKHILEKIEPYFNRLTLFDPRFPHGVTTVRGTRDPLKGRLVIHGWFTDPQPFFSGGLSEKEATETLNKAMEISSPVLAAAEGGRVMGTLTVRLRISGKDGRVMEVSALTDTLIPDPTDLVYDEDGQPIDARSEAILIIHESLGSVQFHFP